MGEPNPRNSKLTRRCASSKRDQKVCSLAGFYYYCLKKAGQGARTRGALQPCPRQPRARCGTRGQPCTALGSPTPHPTPVPRRLGLEPAVCRHSVPVSSSHPRSRKAARGQEPWPRSPEAVLTRCVRPCGTLLPPRRRAAAKTHLSRNPSANMVNRMENRRRTVNIGRLQGEGLAVRGAPTLPCCSRPPCPPPAKPPAPVGGGTHGSCPPAAPCERGDGPGGGKAAVLQLLGAEQSRDLVPEVQER